jgi:hemerythrin-like domain-containing protein
MSVAFADNGRMVDVAVSLPQVRSPAASFEQPFAMLQACHERVTRSLDLLQRLLDHLDSVGLDDQVRAAAHDVWRYFEIAAPAHHADEEQHVLPLLRCSGDPHLVEVARRLQADHDALHVVWGDLGPLLLKVHASPSPLTPKAANMLRAHAAAFIAIHQQHLPLEDDTAFPAALARMQGANLQAMGEEMAKRRGVVQPAEA